MRIMKDRKTLGHQALISATISQLSHRFTPSVPMVKRAIERLIDKEYLERNADDHKLYNYLVRLLGTISSFGCADSRCRVARRDTCVQSRVVAVRLPCMAFRPSFVRDP